MIEQIRKINQVKNEKNIFYFYKQKNRPDWGDFFYFDSLSGTTDTVLRSPFPRLKETLPATLANKV